MNTNAKHSRFVRVLAAARTYRERPYSRGQSMMVIAVAMFFLMGMVGLAVDGGSLYMQRRIAQNGVDAATLAGTRTMLDAFEDTQYGTNGVLTDGDYDQEQNIMGDIMATAAVNGVVTSTLKAYYVNDNKQLVSSIQVGSLGFVPWTLGATGIAITGVSQTSSFFMSMFGFSTLSASATASAFMGPAVGVGTDSGLFPVGFFTNTSGLLNMAPGNTYTIMQGDSQHGPGNWGYLRFNASSAGGSAPPTNAWLDCGYMPSITDMAQWNNWCPRHANTNYVTGPTQYYTGWPAPTGGPYTAQDLRAGEQTDGWWINASTGSTNSSCDNLAEIVQDATHHNPPDFRLPVIDTTTSGGGNNELYHLLNFAWFRITTADVQCHRIVCDVNGCTETQSWIIQGTYLQKQDNSAAGEHGDLMHSSSHAVFLEP